MSSKIKAKKFIIRKTPNGDFNIIIPLGTTLADIKSIGKTLFATTYSDMEYDPDDLYTVDVKPEHKNNKY